ncbi:endonuclease/exonuclease/phosphatase family protein [Euzebya tangerina]|uniref:endonuclease/exonuclease/phosphatase family protein n=1 Tax=Euzebya tangerina TaxID=591198 RepID=UPI000E30BD25|nr:endonuclease/exonuclease/phosphatase family protein [Euzebya tangerina]
MRVLTWNVWWRFGPWEERQSAILKTLADVDADVCLLQEVWATAEQNQAAYLADQLGLQWAWSASPLGGDGSGRIGQDGTDIGLAVLSRWPIVKTEELLLSPTPDVDHRTRTVLHALIDAPDGALPVFTTHLASAPWASAERCAHVRELMPFVVARSQGHQRRPLLAGDFNALPDADETRLLCGHRTAPVVPGVTLVDLWSYAGGDADGHTLVGANPHVRGHGHFGIRIDYLLLGIGAGLGTTGRVLDVRTAGEEPVDGLVPSDHYAVVADLS